MSLTASINLSVVAALTTSVDIGSPAYNINEALALTALTNGSGLNQASYVWSDRRTLALSSSETLTIDAPAARDALGQTLALTKIKAIYIKNRGGSTLSADDIITVGNEASADAWNSPFNASDTGAVTVGPGGTFLLVNPSAAGYAVANTGNYKLKIANTNAAQAIDYDIIIIGA